MTATVAPAPPGLGVNVLTLQAQYMAGAVMLDLIDRGIAAGLAVPHWETDQGGALTGTLAGPGALRQLDAWRRQLPGDCRLAVERRVAESRWTVTATVREISVRLVAIEPARRGGAR